MTAVCPHSAVGDVITSAPAADAAADDITKRWSVAEGLITQAEIMTKQPGIAVGLPAAAAVFAQVDKRVEVQELVTDGSRLHPTADPGALDMWLGLAHPAESTCDLSGPAVPDGLAVKLYPCCYALQRPIGALARSRSRLSGTDKITRIVVRTPASAVAPLIHRCPVTGLEAKYSLEYGVAAALLDEHAGFDSFTDAAVARPAARRLVELVETRLDPGGEGLLNGEVCIEVHTADGGVERVRERCPTGSPQLPPTDQQFQAKVDDCVRGVDTDPADWRWTTVAELVDRLTSRGRRGAEAMR